MYSFVLVIDMMACHCQIHFNNDHEKFIPTAQAQYQIDTLSYWPNTVLNLFTYIVQSVLYI